MKNTAANITGKNCRILINDVNFPTVYSCEMEEHFDAAEKTMELCSDVKCNFVIFGTSNWNCDLSPWEFALNKKMSFSGGGSETLSWLVNQCIPKCEKEYLLTGKRIICGYSLAGLFSLWAFYESRIFSAAVSCSGSLWFGGWLDFAENHSAPSDSAIYLSLGDREEKSRDKVMSTVGDCTRRQYQIICADGNVSRHILEWNAGGHFNEPEVRLAKGIRWAVSNLSP